MNKVGIITCMVVVGVICVISGCRSRQREEQKKRNEELVAAYPEEIKAYLEEKYGREFCVNPNPRGGGGSPIPFASEDYITYKYVAYENEEDGYAFWTEVYPVSLEDKSIADIQDNYCWKFVSRIIKEEFGARWREVAEEDAKIVMDTYSSIRFGETLDEDSEIKEAIESITVPALLDISIICPPGLGLSEDEMCNELEVIANDFYEEYMQGSPHRLWVRVYETYTKEDFLKIEPEKSEQYFWKVKESAYEDNSGFPVELKLRARVNIDK